MSQGEVKNPQTDKRVGNKSGNQGRKQDSSSDSYKTAQDQ